MAHQIPQFAPDENPLFEPDSRVCSLYRYRRMPIILDDFYALRTVVGVKTYGEATDAFKKARCVQVKLRYLEFSSMPTSSDGPD